MHQQAFICNSQMKLEILLLLGIYWVAHMTTPGIRKEEDILLSILVQYMVITWYHVLNTYLVLLFAKHFKDKFHCFSFLKQLYEWNILLIHSLISIWIMLRWTLLYKYLLKCLFSIILGIYLEVELLSHLLAFEKLPNCLP